MMGLLIASMVLSLVAMFLALYAWYNTDVLRASMEGLERQVAMLERRQRGEGY